MLEANKGLRDISFHMTGGNRVAQGTYIHILKTRTCPQGRR